jgi:lysophospholipase L1-like esterase
MASMLDRGPPGDGHYNPYIPTRLLPFPYPLTNLANALRRTAPVKIVALGSSSTAGRADVVPYPYRLERNLRVAYDQSWPPNSYPIVNVLNRGKGGEDAESEFNRLERDVIDEGPVLVIWQIGTNEPWKNEKPMPLIRQAIAKGLKRLKQLPIDVIVMDPQYVPALVFPEAFLNRTEAMQHMIAELADAAKVNLFARYEMMRAWHHDEKVPFDSIIDTSDSDRLHQNDSSTQRVASELSAAIMASVKTVWDQMDTEAAVTSETGT